MLPRFVSLHAILAVNAHQFVNAGCLQNVAKNGLPFSWNWRQCFSAHKSKEATTFPGATGST